MATMMTGMMWLLILGLKNLLKRLKIILKIIKGGVNMGFLAVVMNATSPEMRGPLAEAYDPGPGNPNQRCHLKRCPDCRCQLPPDQPDVGTITDAEAELTPSAIQ